MDASHRTLQRKSQSLSAFLYIAFVNEALSTRKQHLTMFRPASHLKTNLYTSAHETEATVFQFLLTSFV